jgi:thioredoxin reductase
VTSTDVLIVGAGPAGLTAAAALRQVGLAVIVAEREREPGGIPRHTEHLGYGMRDLHRLLSGPAYARQLVDRAVTAGADLRVATTVLDLDGTTAELRSSSGIERVEARTVLLATGVRERPRSARLVPGDRPAGVLTTGALQQFSALHQRVGRRALIVGAEHVSFSAVLSLCHLGCEVAAMITPLPRHQTYAPLRWATATRHRVPIRTGVDVARIVGRHRVEAVELTDGTRIECDTVVFTGDWVPDHELARRAGCEMIPVAKAPLVGGGFHTTVPGVFAAGNLVHPSETADRCGLDGRRVAGSIHRFLEHGDGWRDPQAPIACAPPIRWASVTAGRITLRVERFVTGRVLLRSEGRPIHTTRPMRIVPNRSISLPYSGARSLSGLSLEIVGPWDRPIPRRSANDGWLVYAPDGSALKS